MVLSQKASFRKIGKRLFWSFWRFLPPNFCKLQSVLSGSVLLTMFYMTSKYRDHSTCVTHPKKRFLNFFAIFKSNLPTEDDAIAEPDAQTCLSCRLQKSNWFCSSTL